MPATVPAPGVDLPVRLLVRDNELLVSAIAAEVIAYGRVPAYFSNRVAAMRRVASLVLEHGSGYFRRESWRSGFPPMAQARAVAVAHEAVERLFPELPPASPA